MAHHLVLNRARVLLEMSRRGWTQATLAGLCGVGQSAIAMMLSRKPKFSTRLLGDVARAFGVPVEDLTVGARREKPLQPTSPHTQEANRDDHVPDQPPAVQ